MLFQFLKYLQPTHYFTLPNNKGAYIFPAIDKVSEEILDKIQVDKNYQSEPATLYDASWQLIQKGYIPREKGLKLVNPVPIIDEYRFIRKNFAPAWVFYVLMLRICSFNNPFQEINSWFRTRNTKRLAIANKPIVHEAWNTFESTLMAQNPLVTIIIPTLNRYEYLKDVLKDLEAQDYKNFEVIVVDQSEPYNPDFYKNFNLNLKRFHQKEKALWLARNTAIEKSKGDYLLFFDDDSCVDPNWISNHLKCLDFFKADLSSGVSISKVGAEVPKNYAYFRISDQLDTGNVMIRKEVFKNIGLYDRQFEKQRMGDGEFGMRAYRNGFLNISNPHAKRLHLKVGSGGLRDMGSWDAFRNQRWLSPRPIPSVLYFFRRYFGDKRAKWALLRLVPLSIMPYRFKKNKLLIVIGALVSIMILPLVIFQVSKSWKLSSQKLNQGPLIEEL